MKDSDPFRKKCSSDEYKTKLFRKISTTEESLSQMISEYNGLLVQEKSEPCWKCIFWLSFAACVIGLVAINFWV